MKLIRILSCLVLGTLIATTAFADDSQETLQEQTSSLNASSTLDWLREKTSVSYYGIYYGPSVGDIGSSHLVNEYGKTLPTAQYLLNYLSVSYKASKTLLPGITVMSTYSPVRGQDLTLLDPYLKLTDTQLIKAGDFSLYSELRWFLPVTQPSRDAHKRSKVGTFQWVTYNVPGTKFSVGAWAKFYWSYYGSAATKGTDYEAYLRPQVFYEISRKVSASLYYEMFGNHALGKPANDWYNAGTDVQLGAMVNVFSGLTLNPYLQFATGGKVATDSTAIGAQIFATLL